MSASNHLLQLHNKNLLYFQMFYPALYQKIVSFNHVTNNSLTIEDNAYFDVVNEPTNHFIYGSNSETLSQMYVDNLLTIEENKTSKKVLFNGSLLGIHIEKYLQQIDSDICMIIEPDLEIFRFSTFVVDFENLTKNRIAMFSIGDNDEDLEKRLLEFYYTMPYHNKNITVASINGESQKNAKKINKIFDDNTNIKNIYIDEPTNSNRKQIDIEQIYNKAILLSRKGQIEEAKDLYFNILQYERYIKLNPNYEQLLVYIYKAYLELGNIFINQLEPRQAYYLYARIIYADNVPYKTYEAALSNYGGIHGQLNINYDYIRKKLEKFYDEHPQSLYIKNILISIYSRINEYEKANSMLEDYDIPVLPTFINSEEEMDKTRKKFEQKLDQLSNENKKLTENEIKSTNFFYLANHNRNNKTILTKLSNLYSQRTPSLLYEAKHCKNYRYTNKKIKIGFISNFFQKNHPIGKFINNTIINLDKDKNFEVIVFSHSKSELQNEVNTYITLQGRLKDQRKQIAKHRLDVLIYPEIGMHPLTYFLAHARLAPIQCVMGGHPSTTGIKNIDYYLSQKYLEMDSAQEHYSEKLIKFHNLNGYYHKPAIPQEFFSKNQLGLSESSTNYLIPSTLQKLHPSFDYILSEIIKKDPNAKLIFFEPSSKNNMDFFVKDRLLKKIDKKHFSFRKWAKKDEFFSLLYHANAVIEPTIFGFGTTLIEAFSIGTPIVTLPGDFVQSRGAYTYYKAMGVTDLIASDEDEYVKLSIKLAKNKNFRDKIREKILKNNNILYDNNFIIDEYKEFFIKTIKEL